MTDACFPQCFQSALSDQHQCARLRESQLKWPLTARFRPEEHMIDGHVTRSEQFRARVVASSLRKEVRKTRVWNTARASASHRPVTVCEGPQASFPHAPRFRRRPPKTAARLLCIPVPLRNVRHRRWNFFPQTSLGFCHD
jgi:hypothetical protein